MGLLKSERLDEVNRKMQYPGMRNDGDKIARHAGLTRSIIVLLLFGAVFRISVVAILHPHFVDFYCFTDAAQAIMRGLNPFDASNLRWEQWDVSPLVFPGLSTFFAPFVWTGPEIGQYLYYALNAAAGIIYCWALIRAFFPSQRFSLTNPNEYSLVTTFGIFLFANSIFFTLCIRVGQISNFAALLLWLSLVAPRSSGRIGAFGAAAVLKYSNLPLWSLMYLSKSRWRMCVGAFVIFLALSLVPSIWGQNPLRLYTDYIANLRLWQRPGGGNDFAVSGHTMVWVGFIRSEIIRAAISLAFIAAFVVAVYKTRCDAPQQWDLRLLLFAACLTMLLVYHRIYDAVLVYPMLYIVAYRLVREKKWGSGAVAGTFCVVFALPGAVLDRIATTLGGAIGPNALIHMPQGQFPVTAILMFALTLFAAHLCFAKVTAIPLETATNEKRQTATK